MINFVRVVPAIVLLLALPFFFIGGPGVTASPLFHALWDCGHIVFFALLSMVLVQQFSLSSWRAWLLFTLLVFVLGGAIEIVQAHTGRNGSWQDLLRNLTGSWLGLFLVNNKQLWVRLGRILAVGLTSFNLITVIWSGAGMWYAHKQFPLLGDFESPLATLTMKGSLLRSNDFASSGRYGLQIRLTPRRYSGVVMNQLVRDWSAHSYLVFDLYNPDTVPLPMLIRVSDQQHDLGANEFTDRFNRHLHLQPGWNHMVISLADIEHGPEHRLMNMKEIASLTIFARHLREPRVVYLDNMFLQ